MSGFAPPALAAAVCNAGGLGSIGCAGVPPATVRPSASYRAAAGDKPPLQSEFFCSPASTLRPGGDGPHAGEACGLFRRIRDRCGSRAERAVPAVRRATARPCPEATISPLHRARLHSAVDDGTELTRAFTGRPARAMRNRFATEMTHSGPLAFPLQASPSAAAVGIAERDVACRLRPGLGGSGRITDPRDAGGSAGREACQGCPVDPRKRST